MNRLLPLLALLLAPACSTITTGTTQTVTVTTDPPGASCQLQRGGQTIGIVNPTPGSLTIGKSTRDLEVSCTRPGHLAASNTLRSEFQPMVLGNIILGGIVGIVVDASTGAMGTYAPTIAVALPQDGNPVGTPAPAAPPVVSMEPVDSGRAIRPVTTLPQPPAERGPPRI